MMARELGEQDNARVAEIRRQYSAGAPPSALLRWLAEAGVVGADLVSLFAAAFPGAGHDSAIGVWEAGRRNGNADDVLFDERMQSSMPERGSFSLGQLVPAAQTYQDVRKSYLETTPEDFGLTSETLPYPVFGVLMEVGIDEGLFLLVALADGTTNLHLSNGASTLGAGHHAAVQRAADHLLAGAQHVYTLGHPVSEPASPSVGRVAFSFLVAGPPRHYEASEDELKAGGEEWSRLYAAADAVLTEVRLVEENYDAQQR